MASFLSLSLPKLNLIKASSAATTTTPLSTPEALNDKFGRKGIKFLESNSIPIVELTVRNGSSLTLRLPDAHVTSYKPKVFWKDDGLEELLYTIPANETGLYKAKGGIGLVLNEVLQPGAKELLPSTLEWTVKDVDYDAIDALQGREIFYRVIRMGFEDIYVSSPGSMSDKYGRDYFVCTGPASILEPVTVNPGEEFRGAQVIEHDNLS